MIRGQLLARRWPDRGAWRFSCRPDAHAIAEPAIWLASQSPTTIILEPAGPGLATIPTSRILGGHNIRVDRASAEGRHLVLADAHGFHRLLLPSAAQDSGIAYVLAPDSWLEIRTAAVIRFHRHLTGLPPSPSPPGLCPTRFQRNRLVMMLRILDDLSCKDGMGLSTREIARRHVYPNTRFDRAIEWKSSSERRRTQRLIEEARQLMNGGYLSLLKGIPHPG